MLIDRLSDLRRASRALELSHRRVVSPETIDLLSRSDEGMVETEARTARFDQQLFSSIGTVLLRRACRA